LRFFYGVTLGEALIPERIPYAREPRKLPVVLSADEVVQFLEAVSSLKSRAALTSIYLGGHSYGGRQASMLAAEDPGLAKALLLLSYPLHPPGKPDQLRTAHFPNLRSPAVFVHGAADPFGSIAELTAAVAMIPAQTQILPIEGAGHDLGRGRFVSPALVAALLNAR